MDDKITQFVGEIIQNGNPIAFYSRKLTLEKTSYRTTQRELLTIFKTLKELRTLILGHHITIYIYNKYITYNNFTIERVFFWRLRLEEYGLIINYIKGTDNDAADTLIRIPLIKSDITESNITQ